jgi:integrase
MPLRVAPRRGRPGLWITGTVTPAGADAGVRIRRRAGTTDPRLAREEAAALERRILRDHHLGGGRPTVGWAAAVASYLDAGARSPGTEALLLRLTAHLRDTPLAAIGQEATDRAAAAILRPGAKPATRLRNIVVPIRAVLMHAHRRGWCDAPLVESPGTATRRTPCLTLAQFERLRDAILPRHRALLTWHVGTGCRRGETRALAWQDVDLAGSTARLWADTTKAGRSRIVRLVPAVVAALATLPRRRDGLVFGDPDARQALATAAKRSGVPIRGLHDLRHTWASWHYAVHRDLLALRLAGGWASVSQVETYAHLLPVGEADAVLRVWGLAPETIRDDRGALGA